MILDKDTAKKTAELLLQIKAIKLNLEKPFSWASGWKSPIYCDNRIALSYPATRNFLRNELTKLVEEKYGKPDVIAGVATGGIAIGVLVAQELGVPFVYVRAAQKKHGRKTQIEGHLERGQNIVVVEDLISTGKSCLDAVATLEKTEAIIKGVVSIFSYDFAVTHQNFEKKKVSFTTLSNYDNLLEQVANNSYITKNELAVLRDWRATPSKWQHN